LILHWLDVVDGVMLTGSPSNVLPSHFGETVADDSLPLDRMRLLIRVVTRPHHGPDRSV